MDLTRLFGFEEAKWLPRYGWFHYKEGFSPSLVEWFIKTYDVKTLLDPFAGVGTTLLKAKEMNVKARGYEVLPLGALMSRVKVRNYDDVFFEQLEQAVKEVMEEREKVVWRYELFPPERALPPYNYHFLLKARKAVERLEGTVKEFVMAVLVSMLAQSSYIVKDGGVVKIRKKHVPKAKSLFLRKVKRWSVEAQQCCNTGEEPVVVEDDARSIDNVEEEAFFTSPPYLNNVDYTKVYGFELSYLLLKPWVVKWLRKRTITSFIFDEGREVEEEALSLLTQLGKKYVKYSVVASYFTQLYTVFKTLMSAPKTRIGGVVIADGYIYKESFSVVKFFELMCKTMGWEMEVVAQKFRPVARTIKHPAGEYLIVLRR
jgi:hypothetical protein